VKDKKRLELSARGKKKIMRLADTENREIMSVDRLNDLHFLNQNKVNSLFLLVHSHIFERQKDICL